MHLTLGCPLLRRNSLQLQEDARARGEERLAALRREVYLQAVDEFAKANSLLGSFTQGDYEKINSANLSGFFSSASKIMLVAQPDTAVLANELVQMYNEVAMWATAEALPMTLLRQRAEALDGILAKARAEVERMIGRIKQVNESGSVDPHELYALNNSIGKELENIENLTNEQNSFNARRFKENIEFAKLLMERIIQISQPHGTLVAQLRRDFGLTEDIPDLALHLERSRTRNAERFNETLDRIRLVTDSELNANEKYPKTGNT